MGILGKLFEKKPKLNREELTAKYSSEAIIVYGDDEYSAWVLDNDILYIYRKKENKVIPLEQLKFYTFDNNKELLRYISVNPGIAFKTEELLQFEDNQLNSLTAMLQVFSKKLEKSVMYKTLEEHGHKLDF